MLPTFVELGGGQLPKDFVTDGSSIAPLLLGKAKDTQRKWIMAQGTVLLNLPRRVSGLPKLFHPSDPGQASKSGYRTKRKSFVCMT